MTDVDMYIYVNKQAYDILIQHRATTADIFSCIVIASLI